MGIGFAIPVNMVKSVIAAAEHGGQTVKRPWLGAKLQNVTKDIADSSGARSPRRRRGRGRYVELARGQGGA